MSDIIRRDPRAEWIARNRLHPLHAAMQPAQHSWMGPNGVIRKNPRKTAREEAIAAEIIEQANPREHITGHFPWGPEQQMVLQQLLQDYH